MRNELKKLRRENEELRASPSRSSPGTGTDAGGSSGGGGGGVGGGYTKQALIAAMIRLGLTPEEALGVERHVAASSAASRANGESDATVILASPSARAEKKEKRRLKKEREQRGQAENTVTNSAKRPVSKTDHPRARSPAASGRKPPSPPLSSPSGRIFPNGGSNSAVAAGTPSPKAKGTPRSKPNSSRVGRPISPISEHSERETASAATATETASAARVVPARDYGHRPSTPMRSETSSSEASSWWISACTTSTAGDDGNVSPRGFASADSGRANYPAEPEAEGEMYIL
eukprot:SAG22_NODE_32_length_27675_cov_12.130119_2_plen_290_part_00